MSTKLASKDIGRRKSEFVAMTQFLYIHFCQLYWYEYGTTCLNTKIDIYVGFFIIVSAEMSHISNTK